jgi:hypothetical protein
MTPNSTVSADGGNPRACLALPVPRQAREHAPHQALYYPSVNQQFPQLATFQFCHLAVLPTRRATP